MPQHYLESLWRGLEHVNVHHWSILMWFCITILQEAPAQQSVPILHFHRNGMLAAKRRADVNQPRPQ